MVGVAIVILQLCCHGDTTIVGVATVIPSHLILNKEQLEYLP